MISRSFQRSSDALRPLKIHLNYYDYAEGSALIELGGTHVLCVASVEDSVPPHLRGKGSAWVTGEYNMLPRSSPDRIRRERDKIGGRTHEIQRLIGRAMRSVTALQGWGERTIHLDCDVLRADGGTRTASITGAFVALTLAFRTLKRIGKVDGSGAFPLKTFVSAVSVGLLRGTPILDLDYSEDSTAETDMNLVMTHDGRLIEFQGTAEKDPFQQSDLQRMLDLGRRGCEMLCKEQQRLLGDLGWS